MMKMKAVAFLVVFLAVALTEINADEAKCVIATTTCASKATDAAMTECTKKEPFFKCLRDNDCSTDDATYKAQVTALGYSKCNSGVTLAITWMLPLVMLVMSRTFSE